MAKMIARCGLICTECPALIATRANDAAAIEQVAEEWRQVHDPAITAADVWCDGCLSPGTRHCSHWSSCDVQICASSRGVLNCGVCDDYGCATITAFTGMVPAAKAVLDQVNASA